MNAYSVLLEHDSFCFVSYSNWHATVTLLAFSNHYTYKHYLVAIYGPLA